MKRRCRISLRIYNLVVIASLVLALSPMTQGTQLLQLNLGKEPLFIEPASGTPVIQTSERMPFGLTAPFKIEEYDLSDPADRAQVDQFMLEIDDIGVNVISHHFGRVYDSQGQPIFTIHRDEIELYIVDYDKYFWGASRPVSSQCFLGDIDGDTHQVIATQQDLENAINNGHNCIPYSAEGLAEYENWLNQALDIFNDYNGSMNKFAYFQIGNEPDKWFKKSEDPDPTNPDDWYHDAYVQIVERAYPIIKSRAPNTMVVIGTPGTGSVAMAGFYEPILQGLSGKCSGAGCFDLFDFHLYGTHTAYRERPIVKQNLNIKKSYEYFRGLLNDNGFTDKELVIQQGGTYTGQDINTELAATYQDERMEATFLVKRMAYNKAKGMEQDQIISLIELFCCDDSIHSCFTMMGLEYNGSPVPGGTATCLDTDPIPAQYDCDGQIPCPDPGFGEKKLSYWTYKFLNEKLRGSSWNDIQAVYENYHVYVYKFDKQGQPVYLVWWDWWNETRETKRVALTLEEMGGNQAKTTEAIPNADMGMGLDPNDYPDFFNSNIEDLVSEIHFSDNIAVIRQRSSGKQRMEIYNLPHIVGGDTGSPVASDLSFGNANNTNVAMTAIDIDGDRVDEVAVVRKRANGRQRLEVYRAPSAVDGGTGPPLFEDEEPETPLASDPSFGKATTKRIIAIAGVDVNGDRVDELAVVRQRPNGKQPLEIYQCPSGVGSDAGPPIASDLEFGNANNNERVIAIAGVDTDGDLVDEIAVIRQKASGKQRLEIYNVPSAVGGGIGPPIASDLSFGNANNNNNNIAMAGVSIGGDGIDEIAVVRQKVGGKQRLEIYNVPAGVEGETGLPIASDLNFGNAENNKNNIAIAGPQLAVFVP
jgi:hypothetical protein